MSRELAVLTERQAVKIAVLIAEGMPIIQVRVHPYSGAATLYAGKRRAILDANGHIIYNSEETGS